MKGRVARSEMLKNSQSTTTQQQQRQQQQQQQQHKYAQLLKAPIERLWKETPNKSFQHLFYQSLSYYRQPNFARLP